MKPLLLLLAAAAMNGQSLQILPAPPSLEGVASFEIMLAAGKPLAALQWKLTLAPGATASVTDMVAGSAADSAGKSLTCSAIPPSKSAEKGSVYACILAGGQKTIPSGAVAIIKCNLRSGIREAAVAIREAAGVSPDLKSMKLPDTDGVIRSK
jgi:hypothetical protein